MLLLKIAGFVTTDTAVKCPNICKNKQPCFVATNTASKCCNISFKIPCLFG